MEFSAPCWSKQELGTKVETIVGDKTRTWISHENEDKVVKRAVTYIGLTMWQAPF